MDFSAVKDYMDRLHSEKNVPGCDLMVYYEGNPVFYHAAGWADDEKTVPVSGDTLYLLYSCTKPITTVAALQLVERGKMTLDTPVMELIPAMADAYVVENEEKVVVGHTMTVRHLLTMSAGFDYSVQMPPVLALREKNPDATTREMVEAFVQHPLAFRPGHRFEYSLCMDVTAAVVEAASGMSFGDYLQANIFDPLGMTDIGFFPNEAQQARLIEQYACNTEKGLIKISKDIGAFLMSSRYESGGAGLFASTAALGKFVGAIANGGVSADGVRILGEDYVAMLQQHQLDFLVNPGFGCGAGPNYGYSFGMRTLKNQNGGERSHVGEFGWDGAAGAYVAMDPDAKVGITYCQQTKGWPVFYNGIHAPLRDLIYEAIGV
ncbi:MAG: beta-lactamase family protein [Clostridia bacterium]|nr:beta-lactamase family protein [Clostridia bacterium]